MILDKVIETTLEITKMNDMYAPDQDKKILELLNNRYKGKCFSSSFILEIVKVNRKGPIILQKKALHGHGNRDVVFTAKVLVYSPGEIIHRCQISRVYGGNAIAKSKNCAIHIKGQNVYKVDDVVPVIVKNVEYTMNSEEIAISARPLIPIKEIIPIYKPIGDVLDEHKQTISECQKEANELITKISLRKDPKSIETFRALLYPKKVNTGFGKNVERITIQQLLEDKSNKLVFRKYTYLDEGVAFMLDDDKYIKDDHVVLERNKGEIIIDFWTEYINDLNTLLGFMEAYTPELMKNTKHVWALYTSLKF